MRIFSTSRRCGAAQNPKYTLRSALAPVQVEWVLGPEELEVDRQHGLARRPLRVVDGVDALVQVELQPRDLLAEDLFSLVRSCASLDEGASRRESGLPKSDRTIFIFYNRSHLL